MMRGARLALGSAVAWMGCSAESALGRLPSRDAGSDAFADSGTDLAPVDGVPVDRCAPAGAVFERTETVRQVTDARSFRLVSMTTVRTGTDLRVGTAAVRGSSLLWSVSDDRCGLLPGMGRWWGVQLGDLQRDPDRGLRVEWSCLSDTWAGLRGLPIVTSQGVGMLVRQHDLHYTSGRWEENVFVLGSVRDDPPTFEASFAPLGLQTSAAFTVRDDGVDVVYRTRTQTREYVRLDASLSPTTEPVTLGEDGAELSIAPVGPQPWGDHLIGVWSPSARLGGGDRFEEFTAEGRVITRWELDERVGLAGRNMRTQWLASTDCGVEFIASGSADGATSQSYHGRVWEDGRWWLHPVTQGVSVQRVLRVGGLRVLAYVAGGPERDAVGLMAVDERGAVAIAPTVIDRGQAFLVGDVLPMPGTDELAVLYSSRESQDDPVLAKVALVSLAGGR